MKRLLIHIVCIAAATMITQTANATLVAQWDFSNGVTLPIAGSAQDGNLLGSASLSSSGGAVAGTISGGALTYSYKGNHATDLNGIVITLSLTAHGIYALSSISDTATLSGGLTGLNGTWAYLISSGGNGTFATAAVGASQDLSSLTLQDGDTLTLTYTLSGAVGSPNGTVTFDNFFLDASSITPVPEPTHYALAVFGLIFVGSQFRRIQSMLARRAK